MTSGIPFLPKLFYVPVFPHDCQLKPVSHTLKNAFLLWVMVTGCKQKWENKLA